MIWWVLGILAALGVAGMVAEGQGDEDMADALLCCLAAVVVVAAFCWACSAPWQRDPWPYDPQPMEVRD